MSPLYERNRNKRRRGRIMYDQRPGISTLMTHVPSHTFSTRRSCHFKDRKGAHFRRQHPCLDIQASRSGAGLTPSDSPSDQVEQSLILLATRTGSGGGSSLAHFEGISGSISRTPPKSWSQMSPKVLPYPNCQRSLFEIK